MHGCRGSVWVKGTGSSHMGPVGLSSQAVHGGRHVARAMGLAGSGQIDGPAMLRLAWEGNERARALAEPPPRLTLTPYR